VNNYITVKVDRGAFITGPATDRLASELAQRLTIVTGR
jgi:hypothetical protein